MQKRNNNYLTLCSIKNYCATLRCELVRIYDIIEVLIFALEIEDKEVLQLSAEICNQLKSLTLSNLPLNEKICTIIDEMYSLNADIGDVKCMFLNLLEETNSKVNQFFKKLSLNESEDVKCFLKEKHRKIINYIENGKFLILSIVDYYFEGTEMQ